ncbi:MAG: hypothetical protein HYZ08_02485 [Candidatus Kerfeldbacteria bacterium]|nr:hypothetical protein [Candidatus Kerfeldbacteria bacterium]
MNRRARRYLRSYSMQFIFEEADRRGVEIEPMVLMHGQEKACWYVLTYRNHTEVTRFELMNPIASVADQVCTHKVACKFMWQRAGLSLAPGKGFYLHDTEAAIRYASKIRYPVIVKPVDDTHGRGVYLNLRSEHALRSALKELRRVRPEDQEIMIEAYRTGKDFRVFATRKRVLGVIHRIPANVIGDGTRTIRQLVDLKNQDPRRKPTMTAIKTIQIDRTVREHLDRSGWKLTSIPKKGEQVFLRQNANLSTGGDSVDVTDVMHPGYKKLAVQAIRAIPGLAYAGLDLLAVDIRRPPTRQNHTWIEANSRPMLSMHHDPVIGKSRNIAKELVDLLFPETVRKTV